MTCFNPTELCQPVMQCVQTILLVFFLNVLITGLLAPTCEIEIE